MELISIHNQYNHQISHSTGLLHFNYLHSNLSQLYSIF
jgi:hypothetical protein